MADSTSPNDPVFFLHHDRIAMRRVGASAAQFIATPGHDTGTGMGSTSAAIVGMACLSLLAAAACSEADTPHGSDSGGAGPSAGRERRGRRAKRRCRNRRQQPCASPEARRTAEAALVGAAAVATAAREPSKAGVALEASKAAERGQWAARAELHPRVRA